MIAGNGWQQSNAVEQDKKAQTHINLNRPQLVNYKSVVFMAGTARSHMPMSAIYLHNGG